MQNRIATMLSRQEVRYILVGLLQLVLDWTLFVILTVFGVPTGVANTAGRTCIAILGFCLHGSYTFGEVDAVRLGWRRFTKFAITWVSLTACSTAAMLAVRMQWGLSTAWIVKPCVEAILALISFTLLRRWVYR